MSVVKPNVFIPLYIEDVSQELTELLVNIKSSKTPLPIHFLHRQDTRKCDRYVHVHTSL